jgi:iron complex transport system ATP-binding protein
VSLLVANGLSLPARLRETSLALEAGTLTCLIGPNGSGKTSLLHALAGIGGPSGKVLIEGVDPRELGAGLRQRLLSYLPASRDIHWPLSARDVIALGLGEKDDGAIEAVLAALELEEMAERQIDRMSTGERSRVLIARALVATPRLLLLDEPAANLDPLWQLRMMELVRSLSRRNGQAALVAVHDLELARSYADRLIVMRDCAIEADGDPGELFAGPVIPGVFGITKSGGVWRPVA